MSTPSDPTRQFGQPDPDNRPTQAYSAAPDQQVASGRSPRSATSAFPPGHDDYSPADDVYADPGPGQDVSGMPPRQTYVTHEEQERLLLEQTQKQLDDVTQQVSTWRTAGLIAASAAFVFGIVMIWALVTRGAGGDEHTVTPPANPGDPATSTVLETSTVVETTKATETTTATQTETTTETGRTTVTDTTTVTTSVPAAQ